MKIKPNEWKNKYNYKVSYIWGDFFCYCKSYNMRIFYALRRLNDLLTGVAILVNLPTGKWCGLF